MKRHAEISTETILRVMEMAERLVHYECGVIPSDDAANRIMALADQMLDQMYPELREPPEIKRNWDRYNTLNAKIDNIGWAK